MNGNGHDRIEMLVDELEASAREALENPGELADRERRLCEDVLAAVANWRASAEDDS